MTFKTLARGAKRDALIRALSLSLALLLSTSAARSQDSKAAAGSNDFEAAERLLGEGDAATAAGLLKSVAESRKTDADAWYMLGVALSRTGDNKDARKAFEKSIKLRPAYADAHAGLAYTLLTLGKLRDAEREARGALALNKQNAEAHYVLGVASYRAGNFREAEQEAKAALAVKPALGAAAYLAADSLMAQYFDESDRQASLHPISPNATDEERRSVYALREPALEPIRARMGEVAGELEEIIKSQPNNPEASLWSEQAGSMRFYGLGEAESSGIYRGSEVSVRATILSKPEPGFTEDARRHNVSGTVRLRAVLAADGRVRNIAVVRSLPAGLTEVCINAARRIQFKPAFKDGHAVSQYVTLEYNFVVF